MSLTSLDVTPYRYAMSSIHKDRDKPNWFCQFYDPQGFRRNRSSGTTNARVAKTICATIERGSHLAREGKLSNEKALKLIRETCANIEETHGKIVADRAETFMKPCFEEFIQMAGGELVSYTIRGWLDGWLLSRTDASKATIVEYRRILDLFLKHLGARADRPLTTLQPAQVEAFKNHLGGRVGPSTVNKAVKVLKASLSKAVASRLLEFSPAAHIESIQTEESSRRPFTPDELETLMDKASGEWRTMVLLGYYTGFRLRDCANLTWQQIDLKGDTAINVTTQKTGRKQDLSIHAALLTHLNTLKAATPLAPLCPGLAGKDAAWLSAQFYKVMVDAGLVAKRDHASKGKGRDAKRKASGISFHSLRHNTTSALKSSGASNAVAMDIVGHESEAVSRNYTKIDFSSKREAINKLPDITVKRVNRKSAAK
jgi:integrase